ncbi:hypothetical protein B566_EDAN006320 [Ephemera danica]|nr:hypothetical protein B566_EDAN006320 [Ephemera danica]
MVPGIKTQNFVDEVFRAVEMFTKRRGPPPDFSWIDVYQPTASSNSLSGDTGLKPEGDAPEGSLLDKVELRHEPQMPPQQAFDLDNPESLPRQSIAKGTTPIAARESVIRYQMAMKEDDYTYTQLFRIFIGTWNVNGQPPAGSLNEWLSNDENPPDIYAVGFQELDLSKEAFLFNDTPREEEWLKAVLNSLHPKAQYSKVRLVRLVGMMLVVLAQQKHMAYIRGVASEVVGTGIMGKMGNKGGVAVRLELHNTSICFVNSHLAAHVEEYERRNQDFHDICSRLSFANFLPPKGIKDHDHIYWLGDLNYRITDMDPNRVKELVNQNEFAEALERDQLKLQHEKKIIFDGYLEGAISFKPTYKYDPNTDDWDSSEKNRAPAWCDRVLWKGEGITLMQYRSHPELRLSDHKPVSAVYNSEARVIDLVKYRRIHEDVMKKLDKLENEFLPQVMVDNTEIILDTVRYLEPQKKELIIANTGQVPVQFEFIKKLDDKSFCKEWLSIEPYVGCIMPGEKCDVYLEVFVDKKSAYKLNSGEDQLYDILVLHLEGGKDIFITITEALVHIAVPIRDIPVGKLMELENGTCREAPSGQDPYPVPKEVWFLVDHLYRCGLDQQHLFEHPGLPSELIQIRNWLDEGSSEPMRHDIIVINLNHKIAGSVHSVAEALLTLLESTSEPLIPYNIHNVCLNSSSNYMQCKQIVMQLPEHRKNLFLYLCAFLQEVLNHANQNGLDAKTLATLFGGIFLRDLPRQGSRTRSTQQANDRKKANFVYHFLVNNQIS